MWDELTAKHFFLPADKKANPDSLIPTIPCKRKLEDMFAVSNEPASITLQENLNAARLWEEIEANGSRAANSELLQHFHKEIK